MTSNKKNLPDICDVHTIVFDFDGIFTNNRVWVDQEGKESVCCDRADGLAFDLIRAFKKANSNYFPYIFILSKEKNSVVFERAQKLGIDCRYGVSNKLEHIKKYFHESQPQNDKPFDGFIYLGNDLNDYLIMKSAGYSVAPIDAHHKILEIADLVIPIKGGEGFVRAFIEKFMRLNTLTTGEFDEFISNC